MVWKFAVNTICDLQLLTTNALVNVITKSNMNKLAEVLIQIGFDQKGGMVQE